MANPLESRTPHAALTCNHVTNKGLSDHRNASGHRGSRRLFSCTCHDDTVFPTTTPSHSGKRGLTSDPTHNPSPTRSSQAAQRHATLADRQASIAETLRLRSTAWGRASGRHEAKGPHDSHRTWNEHRKKARELLNMEITSLLTVRRCPGLSSSAPTGTRRL